MNNSRFFFVILAIGAALGIGNIFIYPYFSFNFSGIFFIPYLIALVALGVPLLVLEFSIGQYFSKNVVDLFASVRKWFSSIGWLMVINSFIITSIYAVVIAWHIIYVFVSFGLQWKNSPKNYFFNNVLQASDGFRNFFQLSLPLFIALILAWLIIFLYIRRGYESMKKWFLFTLPLAAILLLLFLFYTLSLEKALNGIYSLLALNFSDLMSIDLWFSAFSIAVLSLGVSFGMMIIFASKSGKGFVVGNSFIVVIFELLVGIAFAFILFSIFGFLSFVQNTGFDNLVFSDYGSLLVILTQALPFFYKPTLLSLLFFVFLGIFFVLGASALAYSIVHVLVHKFNAKHAHASILVAGFGFLSGLLFVIRPGFYIMNIMVHFIYYNIIIALLLEVLAIGWFFNSEKIIWHINQYSKIKIGRVVIFMIRYITPLILLLVLVLRLKTDLFVVYNNYPLWIILTFGVGIVVVPLVVAFLLPQRILDRR